MKTIFKLTIFLVVVLSLAFALHKLSAMAQADEVKKPDGKKMFAGMDLFDHTDDGVRYYNVFRSKLWLFYMPKGLYRPEGTLFGEFFYNQGTNYIQVRVERATIDGGKQTNLFSFDHPVVIAEEISKFYTQELTNKDYKLVVFNVYPYAKKTSP